MNRYLSNLPRAIVFGWIFLLLIYRTDFYYNNYGIIDKIDTVIVALSLLHFILKSNYYNDRKVMFVVCIFLVLQLQLYNYLLTENQYFYTYITIISITLTNYYVFRERTTKQD